MPRITRTISLRVSATATWCQTRYCLFVINTAVGCANNSRSSSTPPHLSPLALRRSYLYLYPKHPSTYPPTSAKKKKGADPWRDIRADGEGRAAQGYWRYPNERHEQQEPRRFYHHRGAGRVCTCRRIFFVATLAPPPSSPPPCPPPDRY